MSESTERLIRDFSTGDSVAGFFYIKESEGKTTASGSKFMNFCFSDSSGEINAKLWEWDEAYPNIFRAGVIVYVNGTVNEWQGQAQLKVERIRVTNSQDNISIENYIPSAPFSGEAMLNYINTIVDKIEDSELKMLVSTILERFHDKLLIYPAAKRNHHAVRCGLLYHTATMLRAAVALSKIYSFLNTDLLYTGVILHDIGKIEEMKINDYGLVTEYSTEGVMLGHLVQGVKLIEEVGTSLGINHEKILMVEHMLLSHHYIPEHGSPKPPMFPEAELLHYLDITDARMYDMQHAYESTEVGTFSERIWSLDNRSIYRSNDIYGDS